MEDTTAAPATPAAAAIEPRLTPEQLAAFWKRVQIGTDSDCWNWLGGRCNGYGRFMVGRQSLKSYRIAYSLVHGPIPKDGPGYHGWCVMHRCDNPSCCNPNHLVLGTVGDNNRDRQQKGRSRGDLTAGPASFRARTQCPSGHPYDATNTRFRANGRRYCGECMRQRCATYQITNGDQRNERRRIARKGASA